MDQFLSVGHICHDRTPFEFCLGGSAAYAAITARNLGCESHIVTSVGPDFNREHEDLEGINIHFTESRESTVFQNTYDSEGQRSQILLGKANPIEARFVDKELQNVDMVFLCPIVDELQEDIVDLFQKPIIAMAPQGCMRHWQEDGTVTGKEWASSELFLSATEIVIVSDEDIAHCPEVMKNFIKWSPIVVQTHGQKGATLYENGNRYPFPAYKVDVVDPTGAGDIFGAAFLIWYYRSGSAAEALKFASCAASFVVEAQGIAGIPRIQSIQNRIRRGKLRKIK